MADAEDQEKELKEQIEGKLNYTGTVYTWLVLPFFPGMAALFILMYRHANKNAIYIRHRVKP
jgi:hypothetical protein